MSRFPITLQYNDESTMIPMFDPSQNLVQIFEQHFPALRSVEFTIRSSLSPDAPVTHVAKNDTLMAVVAPDADDDRYFEAYSEAKATIEIKDRRWMLKTYKMCFTGSDLVAFLEKSKFCANTAEAIAFGQAMGARGLLQHVTGDHVLKNEGLFYRFLDIEDPHVSWRVVVGEDDPDAVGGLQAALPMPVDQMIAAMESLEVSPMDKHNIKLLDCVHPASHEDPTAAKSYNMVVIGAGAAGLVTAAGSAGVGAKVALIERHLLGGDCLNTGCVPSKALLKCAKAVHDARTSRALGVVIKGEIEVDFGLIMERMRRIRADIAPNDAVSRMKSLGIDVFLGQAQFTSKNTIAVNGQTLHFAKACVATGGRAALPPIEGLNKVAYLTNESLFNLTELPKRLGVIGTGAIGCEMAQAFARFGSKVTVFVRHTRIMSREDEDAALIVQKQLIEDGADLRFSFVFESITQPGGKGTPILVAGASGDTSETVEVDALLVATGRVPNVEGLNLEGAGIKYNKQQGVLTSQTLETSNPNVYAAGDVCTSYKFTHMADFMARHVIKNALFFGSAKKSALTVPWCTYTSPEVAHVGLYERDLERAGTKYTTYRRDLDDVDRAICDGETEGFVKIHVEEGTDKILGCTIVATHAGDMISEVTMAMVTGVGLGTMATVIHPYPTQSEAIRQCGDAFNRTKLTPTVRVLFRKLLSARR